ncbi:uncharacterized protein LOC105421678 isoform X2 [Amborella trichopoda]|uniref:uncharacterized protein LOC105421678 isoform X2 n=1 Tax=Amborella trichopoda TaxID=13333 RepID=UPI0009BD107B|nr:uncharacterized protein LOC105421678 isoform X2 [Amborella trichopoda]|eukprot:XP_020531142.1 uncharacterized protein LOC105421678 isoform X2 [Amborella trichopoda]
MADSSRQINIEALISYTDDLVRVLRSKKDITILTHSLEGASSLRSSTQKDLSDSLSHLHEIQKKIAICEEKIKAESESDIPDVESLQKELQQELQNEELLHQELSKVREQIDDLDRQRIRIEGSREIQKKMKKELQKTQSEISMYASVTRILPNFEEKSRVSGYVVERDKKIVERFQFHPTEASDFQICNSLWKMGDV